jgi:hypothetical protein
MSNGENPKSGVDTPPTPPPVPLKPENVQANPGWLLPAFLLVLVLLVGVVGFWGYQRITSRPVVPDASAEQTEARFQSFVLSATDADQPYTLEEWHAARSDHKIIAYFIATCLGAEVADMRPAEFSMLMLDLWPDGDHWWGRGARKPSGEPADRSALPEPAATESASADRLDQADKAIHPHISLTATQVAMLAISDEVARARLAAARGTDQFYPSMKQFGWYSVIISAVATMFVTLKA